jgi:hypothetical protein
VKVYQFAVQDGYEWVLALNDQDYEILRGFDGTPKRDTWTPFGVRLLRKDEDGQVLAESDFPWLGAHAPVLRRKAVDAVGELFSANGELLPLLCDSAELYVFNVLNVVDALDLERSELAFFPNSNRIMRVKRHAFSAERLRGLKIFKVPQLLRHSVYVTEDVVETVRAADLTGVGFRLLWEETATQHAISTSDR